MVCLSERSKLQSDGAIALLQSIATLQLFTMGGPPIPMEPGVGLEPRLNTSRTQWWLLSENLGICSAMSKLEWQHLKSTTTQSQCWSPWTPTLKSCSSSFSWTRPPYLIQHNFYHACNIHDLIEVEIYLYKNCPRIRLTTGYTENKVIRRLLMKSVR